MAVNKEVYLHIHSKMYSLKRVVPPLEEYPGRPHVYSSDIAIIPSSFGTLLCQVKSFGIYESY